jgi:hypothetical protein
LGLSGEPQEEHPLLLTVCLGMREGSGVGNVPGSVNPSCAETIPGGPPTGLAAVPALGVTIPGCPIPGINPGDWVLTEPVFSDFLISNITLIAKNSNAE